MATLFLYSTQDCCLCDQAKDVLTPLLAGQQLCVIDIKSDINLLIKYAQKIPVLRNAQNALLYWPFNEDELRAFMQQTNHV